MEWNLDGSIIKNSILMSINIMKKYKMVILTG